MTDTPAVPAVVAVAVESGWWSKINWTQVLTGASMLSAWATGGKFGLTGDQIATLVGAIGIIGNGVTLVQRTWFTKTVTPASVAQAITTTLPQQTLVHLS